MKNLGLMFFILNLALVPISKADQSIILKGRVLRIEDGRAVIKTIDGNDVLITMTKLSSEDKKKIVFASGKKKDLELRLTAESFAK